MSDSVYRERAALVAHLASLYPSTIGLTDSAEPDWAVVTIETPEGQMCWHISTDDYDLFEHVERSLDAVWDGHTAEEKYERLQRLTRRNADPTSMILWLAVVRWNFPGEEKGLRTQVFQVGARTADRAMATADALFDDTRSSLGSNAVLSDITVYPLRGDPERRPFCDIQWHTHPDGRGRIPTCRLDSQE